MNPIERVEAWLSEVSYKPNSRLYLQHRTRSAGVVYQLAYAKIPDFYLSPPLDAHLLATMDRQTFHEWVYAMLRRAELEALRQHFRICLVPLAPLPLEESL